MNFPNTIFIGAEKAGSTTIYNVLKEHKEIFAIQKETEFFSFYNKNLPRDYYINNLNQYLQLFQNSHKYKIKLDVSTTYLSSPDALINIKKFCPNAKIIICLRNPVDRAYSRYWMSAKEDFEKVNYTPEKFIKYFNEHHTDIPWSDVRNRGLYFENVKKYIKTFGKKNILILLYDDLKKNKQEFFSKIFNFLSLENISIEDNVVYADSLFSKNRLMHKIFNLSSNMIPKNFIFNFFKKIFKKLRVFFLKKYPEIGVYEKKKIYKFYSKDIERLERLIKKNLRKWKK